MDNEVSQTRLGARIDKKYLHKLLRNRIYLRLWGRVHEVG